MLKNQNCNCLLQEILKKVIRSDKLQCQNVKFKEHHWSTLVEIATTIQ